MNEKTVLLLASLFGLPVVIIALETLRTLHSGATFWHRLSYSTLAGGGVVTVCALPEVAAASLVSAAAIISAGMVTSVASLLAIWRHEARHPFR